MSYKIVVDSCCDLTPSMLRDGCFTSVPLTIRVDDREIVDDGSMDPLDFLKVMQASPNAPSTACPSPAQYLDAYDCDVEEIFVLTISAVLSGSHNSAEQAKQIFLEDHPNTRIHVFNSRTAASGEVVLALKIREMKSQGCTYEEVVTELSRHCQEIETNFVLESLENLRKNGRLTGLQSVLTNALRIKLFMGCTPEGDIYKRGQAISMKQALTKMIAYMANDPRHVGKTLGISHCNCLERAYQVRDMAVKSCKFKDILILETHCLSTVYAQDGGIVTAY